MENINQSQNLANDLNENTCNTVKESGSTKCLESNEAYENSIYSENEIENNEDITNLIENLEDIENEILEEGEKDDQLFELNSEIGSANDNLISQTLDGLIFRQRQNLAHELRQLRYSSRLVTSDFGQDTRVRLENLLQRARGTSESVPIQSVSRYRSQDILNEISQLNSVQRVSSILNSNLRSAIESSLNNMNIRRDESRTTNANNASLVLSQNEHSNVSNENSNSNIALPSEFDLLNREAIIDEISDLVHRQLVSNTLQSEFRTVLEERVMERLRRSGTDGDQTRQLIHELSRRNNSNIIRNDFSNLGIYSGRARSDSSASSSAINEPINRASRLLVKNHSKEIKDLKAEIKELKSLVKLSFELTLDIQRSFKQEISGLIANTFHNNNVAKASLLNPTPANEGFCIICLESKIDSVFYECGHMATCYTCSMNLKQQNHNCPVCRAPIKDFIRTYKANPN